MNDILELAGLVLLVALITITFAGLKEFKDCKNDPIKKFTTGQCVMYVIKGEIK